MDTLRENETGSPPPRGAFFFDRDGTLIHDAGYLSDPALVALLPGVRETLLALRGAGFLLFLFTNQSGVARGYFGMEAVEAVNARLARLLGAESGPFFDGVCVAPEHPDDPPVPPFSMLLPLNFLHNLARLCPSG